MSVANWFAIQSSRLVETPRQLLAHQRKHVQLLLGMSWSSERACSNDRRCVVNGSSWCRNLVPGAQVGGMPRQGGGGGGGGDL